MSLFTHVASVMLRPSSHVVGDGRLAASILLPASPHSSSWLVSFGHIFVSVDGQESAYLANMLGFGLSLELMVEFYPQPTATRASGDQYAH